MLKGRVVFYSAQNDSLISDCRREGEFTVDTLIAHIDELGQRPDLRSYQGGFEGGGAEGDRGIISVQGIGSIVHAYFIADDEIEEGATVRIEFFEQSIDGSQPDVIEGYVTPDTLKEVFRLLDRQDSAADFLDSRLVRPIES